MRRIALAALALLLWLPASIPAQAEEASPATTRRIAPLKTHAPEAENVRLARAAALLKKGRAMAQSSYIKKQQSAQAILLRIDTEFAQDPSPAMRSMVAEALLHRARIARYSETIALLDEFEQRFGQEDSPTVLTEFFSLMAWRMDVLWDQGEQTEVLAVGERFLQRLDHYRASNSKAGRELHRELTQRHLPLLLYRCEQGSENFRQSFCELLIRHVRDVPDLPSIAVSVLLNQGFLLYLDAGESGDKAPALALWDEALALAFAAEDREHRMQQLTRDMTWFAQKSWYEDSDSPEARRTAVPALLAMFRQALRHSLHDVPYAPEDASIFWR